jgi:hypothetical protein
LARYDSSHKLSISKFCFAISWLCFSIFNNCCNFILETKAEIELRNHVTKQKDFLLAFVAAGFLTKIIAEIIHEIFGHGLFVLIFGGEIVNVHISLLWPYELSYINWHSPTSVTHEQLAWIYVGGIVICLSVSFFVQTFLLLKKRSDWRLALMLFWLAFWTFANSTGYLIIGGLIPFGDIYELIKLEILTSTFSLFTGLIAFAVGFVALSWILRKILRNTFSLKKASLGVVIFWFIIPTLGIIMSVSPERNLPLAYIPLLCFPMVFSFFIEYFFVSSKQEVDKNPHDVAKE